MKIIIGTAHGIDVAGKRSPDGRLKEYAYSREICSEVVDRLRRQGYDAQLDTTDVNEIGLSARANIVNSFCDRLGAKNVCYVSIHCNAAGNGASWMNATGWEAWTSKGQTQGDKLADCLYDAAEEVLKPLLPSVKIRTDMTDGDRDKEFQFTILTKTKCAAVITENFFMDNRADVDFLLSRCGRDAITRLHVEGIKRYIESHGTK